MTGPPPTPDGPMKVSDKRGIQNLPQGNPAPFLRTIAFLFDKILEPLNLISAEFINLPRRRRVRNQRTGGNRLEA